MEILLQYLPQIFELIILPLFGVLTTILIKFFNSKSNELIAKTKDEKAQKYIAMATETISSCVIATNQTYVEALKKAGTFDIEAQEKAFEMTYNAVLDILTDEAKDYLIEVYGDLTSYLTTKIEAEVNLNK